MQIFNPGNIRTIFYSSLIFLGLISTVGVFLLTERYMGERLSTAFFGVISSVTFLLLILQNKKLTAPIFFSQLFLLFLAWAGVSAFFSKETGEGIPFIVKYASYFFIFLISYTVFKDSLRTQKLFLLCFFIGGISLVGKDFYFYISKTLFLGSAFAGTLGWHNQMAGFLLFLIPLNVFLLLSSKKWYVKVLFVVTLIFIFTAFFYTGSRGGWISFIFGLIVFLLLQTKNYKQTFIWGAIIAIVVSIIFASLPQSSVVFRRIQSIPQELFSDTRTTSGNLRTSVWKNSFRMIADYPLVGVGAGAFGSLYYYYQTDPWLYARNAHNHLLEITAELGLPGGLLFMVLLLIIGWNIVKNVQHIKNNLYLTTVTTMIVMSSVHSFLDFDWSYISLFSVFFILSAILLLNLNPKEKTFRVRVRSSYLFLFPLAILSISMVFLFSEKNYLSALADYYDKRFSEAEKSSNEALRFQPWDNRIYHTKGLAQQSQKKHDDARATYKNSLQYSPFNSEIYFQLAEIEKERKNHKEAEKYYKKAIELNPYNHPKLYAQLAKLYEQKINPPAGGQKAKEVLRKAIYKAFPVNASYKGFKYLYDYTGFNNDLTATYFALINLDVKTKDKKEAEDLIKTLEEEIAPNNPLLPFFKDYIKK